MKTSRYTQGWIGRWVLGVALVVGLSLIGMSARAVTYYYANSSIGDNLWAGLTNVVVNLDGPKFTIGDALLGPFSGDEIVVAAGTYQEIRWDFGASELTVDPQGEVIVNVETDSIGDGIPDWWRLAHFGSGTNTNGDSCASCDPDRDGYSNFDEYQYLTDPNDVTNNPIGEAVTCPELTWLGGGGQWYGVPTPTNLPFQGAFTWQRGSFCYATTDQYTFAWSACQPADSNHFDWSRADTEFNFLTNFHQNVVITLGDGMTEIPQWAWNLDTNAYAAAKGAFIIALAERYTNQIWGIEVQNEPQPWHTGYGPDISTNNIGYDLHLAILSNAQPARAYTKLVGWTCQGAFSGWFQYLMHNGLTNLCDAISWHCYGQGGIDQGEPIDGNLRYNNGNSDIYNGNLLGFMQWLHSQVGSMPILVDEVGLGSEVPMRMAKVLVLLRAENADEVGLFQWSFDRNPPGDLAAFQDGEGRFPWPHAVITAGAAYELGNRTNTTQLVDSNAFVFGFQDKTFAWSLEGTTRGCVATNWTSITDIYGNSVGSLTQLTENVIVLTGTGTITLSP